MEGRINFYAQSEFGDDHAARQVESLLETVFDQRVRDTDELTPEQIDRIWKRVKAGRADAKKKRKS